MSKERYNQIKDEAYKNYVKSFFKGELKKNYEGGGYDIDDYYYSIIDVQHLLGWPQDGPVSKKEFINKCKTDSKFSETWGLKIEEREILKQIDQTNPILKGSTTLVPTKLIKITYNNETIESYE